MLFFFSCNYLTSLNYRCLDTTREDGIIFLAEHSLELYISNGPSPDASLIN